MSFRNEFNVSKIHFKCYNYFLDNFKRISEECNDVENPLLALNILTVYTNARTKQRYRKKLISKTEVSDEASIIIDKFYPFLYENVQAFKKIDIINLVSVIKELEMNDYDEIYE